MSGTHRFRTAVLAATVALGCGATTEGKGGDSSAGRSHGVAGALTGSSSGGSTLLGGGASAVSGAGGSTTAGKGEEGDPAPTGGSYTAGREGLGAGGDAGRAGGGGASAGFGGRSASGGGEVEQAGQAGAGGAADAGRGSAAPLISAFCAAARTCCSNTIFGAAALASCESQLPVQLDNFRLLQQGRLGVDSNQLAACVKAYQDAATTCVLTGLFDACRRVWAGVLQGGDSCLDVAECDRSNGPMLCLRNLATSPQSEPGICIPAPSGRLGDPCVQSCPLGADCSSNFSGFDAEPVIVQCHEADGLFCAIGDDARCAQLVRTGAACDEPGACGSAEFCDTTCRALAQNDQPCQFSFDCAKDLQCSNGSCQPLLLATPALCSGNFNSSGLN